MTSQTPTSARWWRDAVIYQVYVRSFADGDGDGIGDLRGIRDRLDHFSDLGVDALWLTPFYTSPMADGGYDVADYRGVDPMFGDLAEFAALITDAHHRGLRVIVDVVPNHSSSAHVWFQDALRGAPEARARYIFRPGRGERGELPPNDWESIFKGPAWTRETTASGEPGDWYLHLFDSTQPDLDWENSEVRAEFEDILRFWLDLGVDGFRIDVAHGMIKAEGLPDVGTAGRGNMLDTADLPYFDQDGVHEIYRAWRKILDSYPGERIGVAEAWAPTAHRLSLYIRPDELHQAFNFEYVAAQWSTEDFRRVVDESLATVAEVGAPATWVLSNHDIQRHVTRYGGGERGLRRARAAALLTLALPGCAYVYQGEELGLPEVLDLPDEALQDPMWERSGRTERGRDGCRVPIPWSGGEPPFGFGPEGTVAWLPQPAVWAGLTAAAQRADERSVLALYRGALRLRKELPALGDGELTWLDGAPGVLVFAREPGFVCTVNFGDGAVSISAPGEPVLCSDPDASLTGETVSLPGECAVWWRSAGT